MAKAGAFCVYTLKEAFQVMPYKINKAVQVLKQSWTTRKDNVAARTEFAVRSIQCAAAGDELQTAKNVIKLCR